MVRAQNYLNQLVDRNLKLVSDDGLPPDISFVLQLVADAVQTGPGMLDVHGLEFAARPPSVVSVVPKATQANVNRGRLRLRQRQQLLMIMTVCLHTLIPR